MNNLQIYGFCKWPRLSFKVGFRGQIKKFERQRMPMSITASIFTPFAKRKVQLAEEQFRRLILENSLAVREGRICLHSANEAVSKFAEDETIFRNSLSSWRVE